MMAPSPPNPVAERLRDCGNQPTSQRLRIAALLLGAPAQLRLAGMRVSKATVYNVG